MSVVKPQIFNYMAKNKEQKNKIVSNLKEKISQMKSLVFFGYEGLTVKDIEDLRRKCKEAGIEYTVPKKTLLSVAMKEAGVEVNPKDIKENYGIAISLKD
jgi:large subunit ribosomal protein L10